MEVEGIANGYFRESIEEPQTQEEPPKTAAQPVVSANGCFDCNICLDFAVDPVVTLCGHLYCWPCIYRWMQTDSVTVQQCPVCKASLSEDSLVPLYGRGHSTKRAHQTLDIPRRPNSYIHHRGQAEIEPEPAVVLSDEEENYITNRPVRHRHHHYHVHQHEHHHHYPHHGPSNDFAPLSPTLGTMTNRVIHSTAGEVLGGMAIAVLPWVFRNHQEAASMHLPSPNPYYAGANGGSPRQRRQEMEVESSLHQIWVFLFCCAMLCLLLF